MIWLHLASCFFGGAFLGNATPHVVSGTLGRAFQTPFAQPPGHGLSSPTVNVLWGFSNLVVAYLLLCSVADLDLRAGADALALGLGALAVSIGVARHFGRFHGGNGSGRP